MTRTATGAARPATGDWLVAAARDRRGMIAVSAGDTAWTYADLEAVTGLGAGRLAALGLGDGRRIALLADDGAGAVAAIHAVWRLGAVLVPLNRRAAPAELGFMLRSARVAALVRDGRHRGLAAAAAADLESVTDVDLDALVEPGRPAPAADGAPPLDAGLAGDRPAAIVFTSGTSGRPKGALLTVGNLEASAAAWAGHLDPRPSDRWLACLPLFHVAGLSMVVRASAWGTGLEIQPGFDPAAVAAAIERGASLVSLVPPLLERLLEVRGPAPVPSTLRAILLGGGPAPADLVRRALAAGYPVQPTYGLTETASGVAALGPAEAGRRPESAGRALPGVEIRIDRDDGAEDAEPGEILVRGGMVFAGYVDEPDATARVLDGGWLRTGDLGWLDAGGHLVVADRRDDLLISGGENVYPAEVEAVLLAHPAVADAAVVARPDPGWGAVPVAAIVIRPDHDVADEVLAAFCRERLAGYKVPVAFGRVAALPRSPGGKLLRREVRAAMAGAVT